jgi:WD40 repeat protein
MSRTFFAVGLALLAVTTAGSQETDDHSRPLLHLDAAIHDTQLVPVSVARTFDGREVGRFPGVVAPTLSPRGDELAAVKDSLSIITLDGVRRMTIEPGDLGDRGQRFFPTHPAWSPDGLRIAAVTVIPGSTVGDNEWSIVVLDARKGGEIARISLPLETAAGCPYCMAFVNKFRWSPDGTRILLSWGNTVAANVDSRRLNVVSETWSSADWCDAGNTVCFFEVDRDTGGATLVGFFAANLASGAREQLLAGDALRESGLTHSPFVHVPLLNTSADGKQLVINSQTEDGGTVLRFFDLARHARLDLRNPDKSVRVAETVPQVVWSPSGGSLAAIAASGWTDFKLLRFDLSTGRWTVLADLALGPDTPPEAFGYKVLSWAE